MYPTGYSSRANVEEAEGFGLEQSGAGEPRCCYEASSCGSVLYRSLQEMGVRCELIAPGSLPRRTGDRIKTDRRDVRWLNSMLQRF